MRLEHLCDMQLVYRRESFGEFALLRPYGGQEGRGYGEGDGIVTGEKLSGHVRWVLPISAERRDHAPRRPWHHRDQ